MVKNAGDIRDVTLISWSGRSPEGGHGNPLQHSFLENLMDRATWWAIVHKVAKSWTQLKWQLCISIILLITCKSKAISGKSEKLNWSWKCYYSIQFSSVTQSCPTLCDPMDFSTPGFPVHHQLLDLAQTHVYPSVMPSNHIFLCYPLLLLPSIFPSTRVFSCDQFFSSGGQSIGASASASVLPMNIQDFLEDGLVGSPCGPRDSQGSSLTPQFESINSSALSFLCGPTLTSIHDYWKNHSFD